MQIDLKYLKRHYASLSDEALQEVDATELVADARRIYDEELAQRELAPKEKGTRARSANATAPRQPVDEDGEEIDSGEMDSDLSDGPEPDWLDDAAVAASFVSSSESDSAQEAVEARDALEAAGIPCYLITDSGTPDAPRSPKELRLMVPSRRNLEAESVLDKEIFNREVEGQWKNHFQLLSDEELRTVDLDGLFAGLRDRMERVTRAYHEELAERGLE